MLTVSMIFHGLPAATVIPIDLISATHDEFWSASMSQIGNFFSSLDNIIARLKTEEGERFSLHIPYAGDHFSVFVSESINNLDMAKIIEILEAGNEKVIEAVLENGFKYCFREWDRINLFEIPSHLIPAFPIEFLPEEAFKIMNLDSIVECVLTRLEAKKFKRFYSLISKLGKEFWKVPRVRSNFSFRMSLTGFHLGTFNIREQSTQISPSSAIPLTSLYTSPFDEIVEFILSFDLLKEFEAENSISNEIYEEILKQFPIYFYILQTFLHEEVVNNSTSKLTFLIINKSKQIQEIIEKRVEKFPLEIENLMKFKAIFRKCFSLKISKFEEFFISQNFDVSTEEILEMFSQVLNPSDPQVILSVFIMKAAEIWNENVNLNVNFMINENLLEPFKQNSNLIFSFANCLLRNRILVETVIVNFMNSKAANLLDIEIVSRYLSNDFEHLKTILIERENGIKRQFKFSTIFAGSFVDSPEVIHEENGLLYNYTGQLLIKPSLRVTWSDDHLNSIQKPKEQLFKRKKRFITETQNEIMKKSPRTTENENVAISTNNFTIPNISSNDIKEIDSHEYEHVNRLNLRKSRESSRKSRTSCESLRTSNFAVSERSEDRQNIKRRFLRATGKNIKFDNLEIQLISTVLAAIGDSMIIPSKNLKFSIENSKVTGDGVLKDTLTIFGRLISLSKYKTVQFNEEIDGFVPFPLLCPKLMGFLGAWTALCLKHEIPLIWSFAPIFRKFLFRAIPIVNEAKFVDEMIEIFYKKLFESIKEKFDNYFDFELLLPKIMKSHRMFDLPSPLKAEASPFLFENRFLEAQKCKKSLASASAAAAGESEKYLSLLKFSIKKHFYEGREKFKKYFNIYFKRNFHPFLKFDLIDEFIGGIGVDFVDICASLSFVGTEIPVLNDFEEAKPKLFISPLELMKLFLSKLSREQVEKFLWFVTGSSKICSGYNDSRIAFSVKESTEKDCFYTVARVCFKTFTLILHNRSAKQTFEKFLDAITMSSGFASHEI